MAKEKVPQQAVDNGGAKMTMEQVNYRGAGDGEASCANCQYFSPPNTCAKVDGSISPAGICDLYTKKRDASMIANELFGGPGVTQS